jgi:hypothetical protein
LPRHGWRDLRAGLLALAVTMPLVLAVNEVVMILATIFGQPPDQLGHEMLRKMQEAPTLGVKAALVLSAVVVAPVLEEITFRGLVQTLLLRVLGAQWRWLVVIAGAGLFALIHVPVLPSWHPLAALAMLALVLGWLYERTGSLVACIVLHAGFNGVNTGLALLTAK